MDRVKRLLRRRAEPSTDLGRWDGESHLASVRPRIARLGAGSPPSVILEVHLEFLEAFGRSIGSGFHPWLPVEPPSEDLMIVAGRFDRNPGERDFGLWLQPEEVGDGGLVRMAWLIDFYLPERWRRCGAGSALMGGLLELWERVGVDAVRTTATAEGRPAYLSWGFSEVADQRVDDGLTEMRLTLPRVRPDHGRQVNPAARPSETRSRSRS